MKITTALLSPRFKDDGRPAIVLGRQARQAVSLLARELADINVAARISHDVCPFCNHDHATVIAKKDRHGLPLQTQVCDDCELVYSGDYIDGAFAAKYYATSSNVIKFDGRTKEDIFAQRIHPDAYAWRRHCWIKENLGEAYSSIKKVFEAGCADGSNLFPFHAEGMFVFGVDYDVNRLEPGLSAGMRLDTGDLESLSEGDEKANLLILSHCIEHMSDVDLAFRQAANIIGEHGYIYVEVPGIRGLLNPHSECKIIDGYGSSNDLLGYLQVEHNFCFDLSSLTAFAERNGLRRIAGDEIVRALFVVEQISNSSSTIFEPAKTVVNRFKIIEQDYLRVNSYLKRILRKAYHVFQSYLRG